MSARWQDDPNPRDVRIAKMFEHWDERNEDLQRLLDMPHSALAERALELEQAERINLANITALRVKADGLRMDVALRNVRIEELEELLERPRYTLRGHLRRAWACVRRVDWRTVLNAVAVLAFGGGALWLFVLEMVRAGS